MRHRILVLTGEHAHLSCQVDESVSPANARMVMEGSAVEKNVQMIVMSQPHHRNRQAGGFGEEDAGPKEDNVS